MNRRRSYLWGALFLYLTMLGGAAIACNLPAEPIAAIVPDQSLIDSGKVKIVYTNDQGDFYFLVPDNATLTMRVVWDPYDHNGGRLTDRYEWVERPDKGNIRPDANAPVTQVDDKTFGYFPLSAMSQFFTVSGNRGSIIEAFNRANGGGIEGNRFMSDNSMGPNILLSNSFVKPGQEGAVTILDDQRAADYPTTSSLCSPSGADLEIGEIDEFLPNDGALFTSKNLDPPSVTTDADDGKQYEKSVRYLFGKSGIFLGEVSIGLTELRNEDYKAYVVAGEPNVWMGNSLPVLPEGESGGLGNAQGLISVKFPTPTMGSEQPIKLKVNAPAAGFVLTNIFWCWEEETTIKVASGSDGFVIDPANPKCGVTVQKCSVGLKVTVVKPSAGSGFSAFRVYNTRKPITSTLELVDPVTYACGDSGISVPFLLKVYGSDPFADKPLTSSLTGKDASGNSFTIKHDVDGMKNSVKLFMSYPVYDFKMSGTINEGDLDDLQKMNVGLMGFQSNTTPTWKGVIYEPQWVWRPADSVSITSAIFTPLQADDGQGKAGGVWTIQGTAAFNVPVPQHFSNEGPGASQGYTAHGKEYPATDGSDVENVWKLCAVTKDASGFNSVSYDEMVAAANPATPRLLAGKALDGGVMLLDGSSNDPLSSGYNHSPPLRTRIPFDCKILDDLYRWQDWAYLKCSDDNIPPEIQLIVFDTRNNLYHIFGTKDGGDAKIADPAPTYSAYQQANPTVYGTDDNTAISNALKFEALDMSLYDRFIGKSAPGGASTLTESALAGKGFVCQANTRLVFYIRAWDNMNTFMDTRNFGVEKISYEVRDDNKAAADTPPILVEAAYNPKDLMENPPFWQFRAPNVTNGAHDGKEYSITVKAKDYAGKERELVLKVFAVGSDLNIRSLEERRNKN